MPKPPSNPCRRWLGSIAPILAAILSGCPGSRPGPVHDGPIVLITLDALRADIAGASGASGAAAADNATRLTPNLEALAGEATWSGRAVAPSSWTVPSMATLFTGLQPWRHGNWGGKRTVLQERLVTLPEALATAGYSGSAFRSNHWLDTAYGYAQGFELFRPFREGKRARETLRALDGSRQFVWIHILPPHAPYVRREFLVPRLGAEAEGLPRKLEPIDLEPYFDPARPLPEELRRQAWALYRLNAAWSDEILGHLLAALRDSGQWDRTLLAVTSDHGEEFGEMGQVLHGGNLGRQLIEVPLLVKLPSAFPRPLAIEPGQTVATARLFATLIEAAGAAAPAGAAPSLFQQSRAPVLSELYSSNGANLFSLVDGDRQLLWTTRFSPPDPDYYRARLAGLGGKLEPPLAEPAEAVFARLERSFGQAPPLTGGAGGRPELQVWRWQPAGTQPIAVPVDDAALADDLARRLRAAWKAANGAESLPAQRESGAQPQLTEEEMAELRALGYVAGGN